MSSKPTKKYFENLDGLRALAAFSVIFTHLSYFILPDSKLKFGLKAIFSFGGVGGRLGVIFFFILSGFLITYLLFTEQEFSKNIQIGKFYIRRVLRIWPLYFITLIIGFFIIPYLKGVGHENASGWMYLLFLANFDHILHGFPTVSVLGVHWSVCVEEQFYIFWPVLFYLLKGKKYFLYGIIGLIIISETYYLFYGQNYKAGDYNLISCLKYLCIGGVLAYFSYFKLKIITVFMNKINKFFTILIYTFSLIFILIQHKLLGHFAFYEVVYDIVPTLFFVFVILDQNFAKNSFFKTGNYSILTYLGKISYGLYLTHMIAMNIVLLFVKNPSENLWIVYSSTILLTLIFSHLSYKYIESYFLKYKDSFSRI